MRITNNMTTRRYTNQLSKSFAYLNKLEEKVASYRNFQKVSEDPANAVRALHVRRNYSRLEQYKENIDNALDWVTQTETSVKGLNTVAQDVYELALRVRNDTNETGDRQVIATELKGLRDQMLQLLNTNVAGQYILGGPNTTTAPFEYKLIDPNDPDSGMALFYLGKNVDEYTQTDHEDLRHVYVDVGLGLQLDGGEVVPDTAFDLYTHGIDIVGWGVDSSGRSNNFFNMITELIEMIEPQEIPDYPASITGEPDDEKRQMLMDAWDEAHRSDIDMTDFQDLLGRTMKGMQQVVISYTSMGERTNQLQFLGERTDDRMADSMTILNRLEIISPEKEMVEVKNAEMVYRAALQMGSYLLQPSLMDYLR